jgi:transposase
MIGLPAGTKIWLAAGVTDMRAGMNGLAACTLTRTETIPLQPNLDECKKPNRVRAGL